VVKQVFGNDAREVVDCLIGQRADAFSGFGANWPLAERESDVESEIVNVGHVQPPTADATDPYIEVPNAPSVKPAP
jgi:hypothetical protein